MEQENKRRHVPVSLVVFLGMLAAIAPLSTDMYLPALPEMMGNFNVSSSMVQLTLTVSMGGGAAGQLFAGPVSDEKGRRMPLLTAMVVFAVSTLGCFFSNTVYVFLLCRLIQGLSGGAGIVIARAVVRDVASGPALMRLFSMLMLVNGLAPVLGPVIGGQILRFFSWRGVFGFLFLIALCLTAGAAVFRETLKEKTAKGLFWGALNNVVMQLIGVAMGVMMGRLAETVTVWSCTLSSVRAIVPRSREEEEGTVRRLV